MQMDTRIPMMAQNPNPLQAYTSGISAADAVNQINQKQAYQNFITQSGEALYQGDEAALQRYAAFDPEGAFALRGQFEQRAAQQQAQQRAAAAAGQRTRDAQDAKDRENIERGLNFGNSLLETDPENFVQRMTDRGYGEAMGELGIANAEDFQRAAPALYSHFGFDAPVAAEPPEYSFDVPEGTMLADPNDPRAGVVPLPGFTPEPPKPGFRIATQEEAAERGAVGGQFGPDNRFYPTPTPTGMKIEMTEGGGLTFTQGAGVGGVAAGMDEGATSGTTKVAKDYERIDSDDGTFRDVLIKGSPTWTTMTDQSQQTGTALESFQAGNVIVDDMLNRAISIVEEEGIPTTGLIGWASQGIPGTPAHALQQELLGIQTNTAFDFLAEMRRNSPTGGAVGQLSDSEREAMSAIMGSLKQSNRQSDLLYNLRRLQDARADAESRLIKAYDQDFDQLGYTFGTHTAGPTTDIINNMTDAQIRNFDREKISTMSPEALAALFERAGGL